MIIYIYIYSIYIIYNTMLILRTVKVFVHVQNYLLRIIYAVIHFV